MSGVRRRIFTAASAVSLLLCLSAITLWLLGMKYELIYAHHRVWGQAGDWNARDWSWFTQDHGVLLAWVRINTDNGYWAAQWMESPSESHGIEPRNSVPPPFGLQTGLLPRWVNETQPRTDLIRRGNIFGFYLPYWCVVLSSIPLPAIWIVRRLRLATALKRRRCPQCGYSLTGNTSGTCPECGNPIPQTSRPA
jgi:hypothetical protein